MLFSVLQHQIHDHRLKCLGISVDGKMFGKFSLLDFYGFKIRIGFSQFFRKFQPHRIGVIPGKLKARFQKTDKYGGQVLIFISHFTLELKHKYNHPSNEFKNITIFTELPTIYKDIDFSRKKVYILYELTKKNLFALKISLNISPFG